MNMHDFKDVPKQTLLVENGQIGDCWRCCVAALLGLPADQVPHFVAGESLNHEAETQRWLKARGYIMISAEPRFQIYAYYDDGIDVPIMACGPTPRSKKMGQHHAVLMDKHDKVLYDPHPSEAGLTFIARQFMILPLAAITVVKDPLTAPQTLAGWSAMASLFFFDNRQPGDKKSSRWPQPNANRRPNASRSKPRRNPNRPSR